MNLIIILKYILRVTWIFFSTKNVPNTNIKWYLSKSIKNVIVLYIIFEYFEPLIYNLVIIHKKKYLKRYVNIKIKLFLC